MTQLGHNERSYRLDVLAEEARKGLANVEKGEEFTIGGWLAYGHALNEGRALFPGDREFGEWVDANALRQLAGADGTRRDVEDHERKAAMWAAANADQFEEARQRGNPRTMRGIHAKWKEIDAERAEEQRRLEVERNEASQKESGLEYPEPVSGSKPDQEAPPTYADGAATPEASCDGASGGGDGIAAPAPEPEPDQTDTGAELDPYGYAKLTDVALLETANGLRADLDEEKAKRKRAEAERDDMKARLNEALASDDMGRALGNAQKQRDTAKHRLGEEQAKNARQQRRINIQDAEIKHLREQLEAQEVTL